MKKYLVFLSIILGSCFTQEYILEFNIKNKNPFFAEPVFIEILKNELINKLKKEDFKVNVFKDLEYSIQFEKNIRFYTYEIELEELDENLKEDFYFFWLQVLNEVKLLGSDELSEIIFEFFIEQYEENVLLLPEEAIQEIKNEVFLFINSYKDIFLNSLSLNFNVKNEIFSQLKNKIIIEEKKYRIQTIAYKAGDDFSIQATEKQKKIISEIISELGTKGLIALFKKKSELDNLGKQIENVPPMDFMAVIFTQNNLKNHMHNIKKNYFKWKSIIDGFSNNMNKERKNPDFKEKVISFANFLGLDPDSLLDRAYVKDWEGFVNILM